MKSSHVAPLADQRSASTRARAGRADDRRQPGRARDSLPSAKPCQIGRCSGVTVPASAVDRPVAPDAAGDRFIDVVGSRPRPRVARGECSAGHTSRGGVATRSRTTTSPRSSTMPAASRSLPTSIARYRHVVDRTGWAAGAQPVRASFRRAATGSARRRLQARSAAAFRVERRRSAANPRLPFTAVTDSAGRALSSDRPRRRADTTRFASLFDAITANIAQVVHGKMRADRARRHVPARRGPPADRGRAGRRQDQPRQGARGSIDCTWKRVQFTPDLLPTDLVGVSIYERSHRAVPVPARPAVRQHRARRRDQPRLAEDAVGAARGDGGAPGHRRRHDPRAAAAVHGHRHAEPGRAGGHLPAAREPARPLPAAHLARLPGPRRRDGDPRRPRRGRVAAASCSRSCRPTR